MRDHEYDYEYHDLAEDADFIDQDENCYDDGVDEPWMGLDDNEDEVLDSQGWENYYHNLADEIDED